MHNLFIFMAGMLCGAVALLIYSCCSVGGKADKEFTEKYWQDSED